MIHKSLTFAWREYLIRSEYYELRGRFNGPHIFISGGMHGNEINGVYAAAEFLKWAKETNLEEGLRGRITVIPVLNTPGYAGADRYVSLDWKDLNRQFLDHPPESISQFMAQKYTELLQHCQLGIDLHDAGEDSVLLPHVRVHKNEEGKAATSFSLAQLFGTRFVLLRDGDPGMMAVAFKRKFNMPVVTVEIGGAKRIFTNFVNKAVLGIQNILIGQRMIDGDLQIPSKQILVKKRFGVQSKMPGIVNFKSRLGALVSKGEYLGSIYYPQTSETVKIISPVEGKLFSRRYVQQVPADGTIYSILEPDLYEGKLQNEDVEPLPHFEVEQLSL